MEDEIFTKSDVCGGLPTGFVANPKHHGGLSGGEPKMKNSLSQTFVVVYPPGLRRTQSETVKVHSLPLLRIGWFLMYALW